MKFYLLNLSWGFLSLLAVIPVCFGQEVTESDKTYLSPSVKEVTAIYKRAMGVDPNLYNGAEYVDYNKYYTKGHQFFITNKATDGVVYYNGTRYASVPLRYDIQLDQVVLEHPNTSFKLRLVNEQIKYFTLHEHTFIRLVQDSVIDSPVKTGFYDLLFEGKIKLLAKRTKRMQKQATEVGMRGKFLEVNKYYVWLENAYYQADRKKLILKAFRHKKKELQQYIRTNKLNFRKSRETAVIRIVQHYNQLIQ